MSARKTVASVEAHAYEALDSWERINNHGEANEWAGTFGDQLITDVLWAVGQLRNARVQS